MFLLRCAATASVSPLQQSNGCPVSEMAALHVEHVFRIKVGHSNCQMDGYLERGSKLVRSKERQQRVVDDEGSCRFSL